MKPIVLAYAIFFLITSAAGQMDLPASGGNTRAKITEEVGITDISISYSRPDVNGREGKIWGELVTWGFSTNNLNTNKNTQPWRAGANENTTITFEHDVKFEGRPVKAGTYAIFMAMWPDSVTIILSSQSGAWGSFYYEDKYDAARVTVKTVKLDKSVEWLKYEFIEQREKYCVIAMQWEKLSVPFKVEVDVDNIVAARLREQVNSVKGFNALLLVAAANYLLNKNIYLEDALNWAQRGSSFKSYSTLRTLATAYEKLNRLKEADSVMAETLGYANVNQYVAYGRALITQKRFDKALEIMLANQTKNGDVFAVYNGLMYAYAAKGNFKEAQAAAEKALAKTTNDATKKTLEGQIAKLKENKDVN